ncbi:hypothetical protein BKA67DRAFT_568844 [Truncatella angustata]|uniref:Uncharacterized protein n=1 Tax=Truncatella angustata TaxID=152316 RepID=A0A9P8UIW8_9PEZI|nr:uncharacterized protein BKA67DRAFT_568844 [Truncatella angustata]KAH6653198.1 hypothetical protein BKA67DRAFT_568844 [Truncatella angustata]
MTATTPLPERYSASLTVQSPLGSRTHGPGLIIISPAGAPAGLEIDPQQTFAQEGYTVAHLRLSSGYSSLRIRDELREATEALDFHDCCSEKSRYGIIVYCPSAYPYLVEAINGNGEIKSAVFFGELPSSCLKPHTSVQSQGSKFASTEHTRALNFLGT